MLRATLACRTCAHLNGFAVFAHIVYRLPEMRRVQGGFEAQAAVAHEAWRLLRPGERARFSEQGCAVPAAPRARAACPDRSFIPRNAPRSPRAPPAWHEFVRDRYATVAHLPVEKRLLVLSRERRAALRAARCEARRQRQWRVAAA
jgi:hypothetical protein